MAGGKTLDVERAEVSVEYSFQTSILAECGIDIKECLVGAGWDSYFREPVEVYPELVKMFWKNASVSATEVRGCVLGKPVVVSEVTISNATQCWLEGATITSDWEKAFGGTDAVLDTLLKESSTGKITASKMNDKARVLHQLLKKAVLHEAGSKDSVSTVHAFCLCHLMLCQQVNLPSLLFKNFKRSVQGKGKKTTISYGVLLTKIFRDQGIFSPHETKDVEEKKRIFGRIQEQQIFGRSNLLRMKLQSVQDFLDQKEPLILSKTESPKKKSPSVQALPKRRLIMDDDSEDDQPIAKRMKVASIASIPKGTRTKLPITRKPSSKLASIPKEPLPTIPSSSILPSSQTEPQTSFPTSQITSSPLNTEPFSSQTHILPSQSPSPSPSQKTFYNSSYLNLFSVGVSPHIIPLWESKDSSLSLTARRSRCCDGYSTKVHIFPSDLSFKPVTLEEMGQFASPYDTILVSVIKGSLLLKNLRFVPPSLIISSTTAIKIQPDRVCPRLPMVDLNKNKDLKKYRSQATFPKPIIFKPNFGSLRSPDVDVEFLWHVSNKGEAVENEAKTFWEKHIWECEQQASSSGLSDEDKEDTITVPGQSFQCFRPIYMVDDLLGLPLNSPLPTIFSCPSYVSGPPSDNIGRPYPWDQMFGYRRTSLPWDVDLPLSEDEVESVVQQMDVTPPASTTELAIVEPQPSADILTQVPPAFQAYVNNQMDLMYKRVEDLLKSLFQQGPPPPPPPSSS